MPCSNKYRKRALSALRLNRFKDKEDNNNNNNNNNNKRDRK